MIRFRRWWTIKKHRELPGEAVELLDRHVWQNKFGRRSSQPLGCFSDRVVIGPAAILLQLEKFIVVRPAGYGPRVIIV